MSVLGRKNTVVKGGSVECVHPQHERPGFCSWLLPHTPMNGVHQHMQCVPQNVCGGCWSVCQANAHLRRMFRPWEPLVTGDNTWAWCQGEGGPHSVPHCSGCMSDTTTHVSRIPCERDIRCCECGQWQSGHLRKFVCAANVVGQLTYCAKC